VTLRFPACLALLCAVPLAFPLAGQGPDQVLVVINRRSADSRALGQYYIEKRHIPAGNICTIDTDPEESTGRDQYNKEIEAPIAACLKLHGMEERILYIVLMRGVPLKMWATSGDSTLQSDGASVDSELTLLYARMKGTTTPLPGYINNPFFRQRDTPFRHPTFPIYLVTRIDGWSLADAKALIDRSLAARNTGKFVIDLRADEATPGNQWLRGAALLLPKDRVVIDESATILQNVQGVIGYASWGSNDKDRKQRIVHMQWFPGAIAVEFVSTNARTMKQPPANWTIGPWGDRAKWFEGAPQTLLTDYLHDGASGGAGSAFEPFLEFCPRPDFVLPAYYSGRNLAESFYMGIPAVSWMTVVIGDPLMRLAP
jgi:uncharacterized protein (TIGR03790 family)